MLNFYLLIAVVAYLIGSFPTAYLFVKKITGQDIRKIGSGNVGAMNLIRALKGKSKRLVLIGFLVVLFIDMAKAGFSIFLAQFFLPFNSLALIIASFFVVLGHNHSIFLKLSGGRGAASLIGLLLYLDVFSFLVWALPIVLSTIFAQMILEKTGFERKINWRKISEVVALLGTQMAGRMAGLILALIPLYFYNPQIFLSISAGTILLLIKNLPRFKGYFLGERVSE